LSKGGHQLPPPASPAAASPAYAPAPEAPQPPSGTPQAVSPGIAPEGSEAVAPGWPSSHRSVIGPIGNRIGRVAHVEGAVRVAPAPSATGHGTHPGRSSSIEAWHLVHLLPIENISTSQSAEEKAFSNAAKGIREGPTPQNCDLLNMDIWAISALSPSPSTSTPAVSQSSAKRHGGETCARCRENGWHHHLHRRASHSCVTVRRPPRSRRREHDGTVPLPAAGHRTQPPRSSSIKTWHPVHLLPIQFQYITVVFFRTLLSADPKSASVP